jgi:Cu(I)/Ag(I) efflux system membrane fusion protein/cobalt-zinc-cadmium efflux system membrane fusion protein
MTVQRWIVMLLLPLVGIGLGWWVHDALDSSGPSSPEPGSVSTVDAGPCPRGGEPLYWKAPMDPTYVRDRPGKSPMGMDLVPACPGEGEAVAAGTIRVDPRVVQNIGVRTMHVERRDLSRTIRAVGRVSYDERLVSHVHTKVQGWVEKLYVEYEGQMVKPDQQLLEIYSPELVSTQEELLIAARYRDETSGSAFSDVQEGGESLLDATRRRLELWDIPDRDIERLLETGEIHKTLTLYAPSGGVVTHMMVRGGMEVGPNDNLYTIADLSRVWVYADVYEYELPWVRAGQHGAVELSYLPGVTFEGEVTYVYPFLDPKTRTARIRLELANPEGILKPDMYANVSIETETQPEVLAIPDEALIRSGKRNLVIVALGDGHFEPRQVELGIDSGEGWVEVRSGLRDGEDIVTSGQFLIDSESKLQEAVQKLLGPKPATDAEHEAHVMPMSAEEGTESADPQAGHETDPPTGNSMEGQTHTPRAHEGHAEE